MSPLLFALVTPRGDRDAWLPLADGVVQRVRRRRVLIVAAVAIASAAVVVGLLAFAAGSESAGLQGASFGAVFVVVGAGVLSGAALLERDFIDIVPIRDSDRVELRGVHPAFVERLHAGQDVQR